MIQSPEKSTDVRPDKVIVSAQAKLDKAAQQFTSKVLSSFERTHTQNLQSLAEIHKRLINNLNASQPRELFWQELETSMAKLLEWINGLSYIDEENSLLPEIKAWREAFGKVIKEIPPVAKEPIGNNDWEVLPEDTIKIRTWKKARKIATGIQEKRLKSLNMMRRLLGRAAKRRKQLKRNIPVHLFLRFHDELAIAEILAQEWQLFLKSISGQLHSLQQTSVEMFSKLVVLDEPTKLETQTAGIFESTARLDESIADTKKNTADQIKHFKIQLSQLNQKIQHNWQFADTMMLPNQSYSENKISQKWQVLEKKSLNSKPAWERQFVGQQEDWTKDLELCNLQSQVTQTHNNTRFLIDKKINEKIIPKLKGPHKLLSDSLTKFEKILADETADLQSQILEENRTIVYSFRREKLPEIIDAIHHAQIPKALENFLSRVQHSAQQLPEKHRIFSNRDLAGLPPESKLVEVSLKGLLVDEVCPRLVASHNILAQDVEQRLTSMVRDVAEIDQIVEFNLESALDLLGNEDESSAAGEVHEVVIEGLERARNKLDELKQQNERIAGICSENLRQMTDTFGTEVAELRDNEKIIALKLRAAKAKTREEIRSRFRKALANFKAALPAVITFLLTILKRLQTSYLKIRKVTGLGPVTADAETRLLEFVSAAEKQQKALPYVYKRLFQIKALEDERFLAGREGDLERLKTEFESWQAGHFGIAALVGEKGSGKTTLLNFAMKKIYHNLPILKLELTGLTIFSEDVLLSHLKSQLNFGDVENLDVLEEELLASENRRIIIVEDLQNLFIRTVKGFDTLERFLLLVSRTHSKIYWVLSCTLYSWNYLDRVVNISRFVRSSIMLGGIMKTNLEELILKRHRVSGYGLQFEVPDEVKMTKKFRKLTTDESRQTFLHNYFFEQLHDHSAGNVAVAMMFWLSAIRNMTKEELQLSPKIDFDNSFLYQLPVEELFALAALIQHEMLTAEEHARVFRQEKQASLIIFNRMKNRGILVETQKGFHVRSFFYRPVVQALKSKNIIH